MKGYNKGFAWQWQQQQSSNLVSSDHNIFFKTDDIRMKIVKQNANKTLFLTSLVNKVVQIGEPRFSLSMFCMLWSK